MKKDEFKKYPNVFIGSDIHFNHKNILKYNADTRGDGRDYDNLSPEEVTSLVTEMNEKIISNWNSLVSPDDLTFILGDICMGQMIYAVDLINRLNGFKYIIIGNHDRGLLKLPEFENSETRLKMKIIGMRDYLCFSPTNSIDLVFSHYPMASWDGMGRGSIMLHGHLHGAPVQIIDADKKRIFDVGIDNNNLYPFRLDSVVARMKDIPLPSHDHHMKEI